MPSLSLDDARRRAELLTVTSYDVHLDLTADQETFRSRTTLRFTARHTGDTFVDLKPRLLRGAWLDGTAVDTDLLDDGRLPLAGLGGEHELVVEAVMAYRKDGEGLHRAVDPADGQHYTYAMSFLDAAPSIFACFDQPDLKAPYTFHVTAPEGWLVVGNGRAEQVARGEWRLTTTQPLSTYFVTLVAGPYHQIVDEHDGIALGLECRASMAAHLDREAEEILTVTRQSFDELHRLFGIRYAFGDYHQAFVPEFNAGAMENPGCVTFRDPLVFTSKVTLAQRASRASTIAHEMAHQWFGDLVTMRWWDDLWLNESFAEYMGSRVTHEVTEFAEVLVDEAWSRKRWGLRTDHRPSTHPVAGNGATDAQSALQDFDGISYVKGAAVLKQLNSLVGDKVFFRGLRDYFERHRFGNATMHDLFAAWESAGARDLDAWTEQWLRTAGPDHIALDRESPPSLRRTAPADHDADRTHAFTVAVEDGDAGWTMTPVVLGAEAIPAPPGVDGRAVVLDPTDETWARFGVDAVSASRLPGLLPVMHDPLMRASVWNAIRSSVDDAGLDPADALVMVEASLPHETQDIGVGQLTAFGLHDLAAVRLDDHADATRRVHAAARARLDTAAPGSGVQLAAVRAVVAGSVDAAELRGWLDGASLPDGVTLDSDLRWKILIRLSTLGEVRRDELHRRLDEDPSGQAKVDLAQCLAALPDEEAKAWAWACFTGAQEVPNYELYAAGAGMWRRGQEAVTAPYVERYFDDVAATAKVRSGWVVAQAAETFFPALAVTGETLLRADRLLDDPSLDQSLRRVIADSAFDLRQALTARRAFGGVAG